LRDVKAGIVLGETFENIFGDFLAREKVRIVKNYSDPEIMLGEEKVRLKFSEGKFRVLYMSNFIPEKGYRVLVDAFMSLPAEFKNAVELHLAGFFNSPGLEEGFKKEVCLPGIVCHGPVSGSAKRELLQSSHIFCLPTYYKFEGQPISIIEAYAAGCFVITTNNGGIKDIFEDGKNGRFVGIFDEAKSREAISMERFRDLLSQKLAAAISQPAQCAAIAVHNRNEAAQKYSKARFCAEVEGILFS
jgi:glycosyltransferase involved in cell wall biosynthesis